MSALDDLQEARKNQSGLPLKTTESYPITPNYRFELAHNGEKFISKYGVYYIFNSTGARSTLSDYFGRIDLDAIINGNQVGLTFEHQLHAVKKWGFSAYAEGAYLFTKLRTRDYLSFVFPSNYTRDEKYIFNSNGFTIESGVQIQYSLKYLRAKVNLGYLLNFSEGLYLYEDKDQKLMFNNEEVNPEWSGLRLGLQVDFLFS